VLRSAGANHVAPTAVIQNLGIFIIDADVLLRLHAKRTVSPCFSVQRQLYAVDSTLLLLYFVSAANRSALMVLLVVLCHLDRANVILAGNP